MKKYSKYSPAVLAAIVSFAFAIPAMAANPPVTVSGDAYQSGFGATNAGYGLNSAGASFDQGSGANYTVSGGNVLGAAGVGSMSGVQANVVTSGNNTHVSAAFAGTENHAGAVAVGPNCGNHAGTSINGNGFVATGTVASVGVNTQGLTTNGAQGSTNTAGSFSYSADPHSSVAGQGMTVGGGTSVVTNTGNGFMVTTHAGTMSAGAVTTQGVPFPGVN
ncbi:MAG: hypothetical protein ACYC4I_00435 [Minisyncoccota bacterium]